MPFDHRDPAYLWEMVDAARRIQRFTSGVSQQQYLQNEMMQSAVERMIEVIGEAARKVSGEFKQAIPKSLGGRSSHNEMSSLTNTVR